MIRFLHGPEDPIIGFVVHVVREAVPAWPQTVSRKDWAGWRAGQGVHVNLLKTALRRNSQQPLGRMYKACLKEISQVHQYHPISQIIRQRLREH